MLIEKLFRDAAPPRFEDGEDGNSEALVLVAVGDRVHRRVALKPDRPARGRDALAKGLLLVLSNAVEGGDEKFNEWYTKKHLRDVLAVDGFVAAQRFRLADVQLRPDQETPHRYLAIYELEADDLETPLRALLSRVVDRSIPLDDSLALDTLTTFAFLPITERISAGVN